jgi:hypothetical protein
MPRGVGYGGLGGSDEDRKARMAALAGRKEVEKQGEQQKATDAGEIAGAIVGGVIGGVYGGPGGAFSGAKAGREAGGGLGQTFTADDFEDVQGGLTRTTQGTVQAGAGIQGGFSGASMQGAEARTGPVQTTDVAPKDEFENQRGEVGFAVPGQQGKGSTNIRSGLSPRQFQGSTGETPPPSEVPAQNERYQRMSAAKAAETAKGWKY